MRVFNSAIVASRSEGTRDFSAEIYALVQSPAYEAILASIDRLARVQGVSEREAAEAVIRTFRKLDQLWGDYILQEGLDRLKGSSAP